MPALPASRAARRRYAIYGPAVADKFIDNFPADALVTRATRLAMAYNLLSTLPLVIAAIAQYFAPADAQTGARTRSRAKAAAADSWLRSAAVKGALVALTAALTLGLGDRFDLVVSVGGVCTPNAAPPLPTRGDAELTRRRRPLSSRRSLSSSRSRSISPSTAAVSASSRPRGTFSSSPPPSHSRSTAPRADSRPRACSEPRPAMAEKYMLRSTQDHRRRHDPGDALYSMKSRPNVTQTRLRCAPEQGGRRRAA